MERKATLGEALRLCRKLDDAYRAFIQQERDEPKAASDAAS